MVGQDAAAGAPGLVGSGKESPITRFIVVTALLCAACAGPEQDAPGQLPAITPSRVGCVHLDATEVEVREACDVVRDTALTLEDVTQEALLVRLDGAGVVAEIEDGRVWRIWVLDPGPMTSDSLEVGSPAYALSELDDVRVLAGEGRYFAVTPEHCGLSFELEGIPVGRSELGVADLTDASPDVRVSRILIVGGCRPLR